LPNVLRRSLFFLFPMAALDFSTTFFEILPFAASIFFLVI